MDNISSSIVYSSHDIYVPLRSSSIHQHSLIFFFFFLYKGEKWQFDPALPDQAISCILSWTLLGHSVGVLNVSCFSYWLTVALGFSTACKQCEQCKQCKKSKRGKKFIVRCCLHLWWYRFILRWRSCVGSERWSGRLSCGCSRLSHRPGRGDRFDSRCRINNRLHPN